MQDVGFAAKSSTGVLVRILNDLLKGNRAWLVSSVSSDSDCFRYSRFWIYLCPNFYLAG